MVNFDRENFIKSVATNSNLFSNNKYTYLITHAIDENGEGNVILKSLIDPESMELLIYSFQSIAWEVNNDKVLWQPNVAKILTELFHAYEAKDNGKRITLYRIDLHDNWECWTGVHDEIMQIEKLKNEKVVDMVREILESE